MRRMIVGNELFYDAANRIRWCLIVLNLIQFSIGIVLVVVGSILCYHMSRTSEISAPHIWLIGLPHILLGVFGVASLIHAQKTSVKYHLLTIAYLTTNRPFTLLVGFLILAWLVLCVIVLPVTFTVFTLTDCFETAPFWVQLQVYGDCSTQHHLCVCVWSHSKASLLSPGSCGDIKWATTLYLCVMCVFILGLVLLVIIMGLGFIMTLCIKYCIPKEIKPLYSSCTTANGIDSSGGYFRSRLESQKNGRTFLAVPVNDRENSTSSERTLLTSHSSELPVTPEYAQ